MGHQNSSEPEDLNLNILPEEILLQIFKYLHLKDILNIALASKRFSRIVNDYFNILAPRKHRITLNCWNENRDWIGSRKYSNFIIDSTATERFQQIISTKSHQVVKLSLNLHNEPQVDVEIVREILIKCENLKELTVNFSNLMVNDENSLENMPKLRNLEKLDFYGHSRFFNLFMNFQFKVLKLRFLDVNDSLEIFKNFLKKQKILTELKVFGHSKASSPQSIFDDEKLEVVDFRLKKFKISHHFQFFDDDESFNKFLLNHQETLIKFSTTHSEINLDIFNNFKNLKNLKIERSLVITRADIPNVENVIIKRSSIGFVENLPHLKNLKILESTSFLSELNFKCLRNLETLEIFASHIPQLVIPSVKNLKIFNAISFDIEAFPLFRNNVENLIFKNCENVGAIFDYLNQPETKLKSLKIEDSKIERKCLTAIKRNREKIEVLEMKRCKKVANILYWKYVVTEGDEIFYDQLRIGIY